MEPHQHQQAASAVVPSALAMGRAPEPGALPSIPVHEHKAVMAALRAGVDKLPTLNDLLVHEGGTIWMKSARGNRKVSELFDVRGTPLEQPVTAHDIQAFLLRDVLGCKTHEQALAQWDRVKREFQAKGSFSETLSLSWGVKARVMLFRQGKGRLALNVRLSRSMPPPLEQLGLPQQVLPVLRGAQRGLVLLTGPMSSGKTSTAQAILHHRNTMRPGHIVTIEDPIETDLQPSKCLITTKEVGTDVPSFHAGLLDALRQACDVLFIGELRDADTIRTAITAAASGILVIATTHGDTCTGTLSKMMTLLGAEAAGYYKLLAQNLVCVIRQAMVPSSDGSSWHVVADALLPKPHAGQVAGLLEQGDIAKLEGQLAGATPQQRSEEWVSMNDQLSTLVKEQKVQLAVARQVSTLPKGLAG